MKNIGKRLVYLVLALVLVGTLPLYANAADTFDYGLTYELSDDGTLTISGNGAMKDYGTSENWPWHGQKRNIKHVVIGPGVTYIGKYAFHTYQFLETITIQGTPEIGSYAFAGGYSVTSVTYNGTVSDISSTGCFNYLHGIRSFTLREGVGRSSNAFYYTNIPSITLTDSSGNDKTAYYSISLVTNTHTMDYMTVKGNLEKGSLSAIPEQLYTGSPIEPAVTVTWNGQTVDPSNYTVIYENNTQPGTATVTVTGNEGNYYTGTLTQTFTIIEPQTMTLTPTNYSGVYDGKNHGITPVNGLPEDGTISYSEQENGPYSEYCPSYCNAGNYTIYYKASAPGYYEASGSGTVTITPRSLNECAVSDMDSQTYTGSAFRDGVTVTDGNNTLTEGTDYTLSYSDNTNVGTATVTVTGKGNYTGILTKQFQILTAELQNVVEEGYNDVYDGQPHGITVSASGVDGKAAAVKYGTVEGTYDLDTSPTITDVGSITVYYQVTLANHHSVTGCRTVTVEPKPLSAVIELPSGIYNGEVHTPTVSGLTYESLVLKEGIDYELGQWSGERIIPGAYTIPVTGKGNYAGTTDLRYTIQNAELTDVSIRQVGSLTYNGKAQTPEVDVTARSKGNQGVTFTYSMTQDGTYGNLPRFREAGEYLVYCKASAAYHNDVFTTFCVTIDKAPGVASVTMEDWAYGEEASVPAVTSETNSVSQPTVFYKEASADDSAYTENLPVNAGNYTVKAVLMENTNYTEAVATADFTIRLSNTMLTAADFLFVPPAELIYNGTAKAATVTASEALTGVGEITVKYDRDPVNAGTCKVFVDVAQGRNYKAVTDLTSDAWTFTIAKADPGISWEGAVEGALVFTYNARPQGEARISLVNGETYTGTVHYTSVKSGGESITGLPTDAGDYTVTAYFPEQPNYNAATDSIEVVIKIKEVIPTVVLTPETYSFDGQAHMPAVKALDGEHEIPADEYRVEYGNHTAVGAANAWILDADFAGNYMIPQNTKGVFLILPDASALDGITVDNVTSSHQDAIDAIQAAMEGKDISEASETAQKEWNDLLAFCAALEARIRDVKSAIEAITEGTAALPQQPTTDNLDDIQDILDQYTAIEDNLTEEEKESLADEIAKLEELKEAIESTNADLKEITDGIEALKQDELDYEDKVTIAELQKKIDALEPNPYLTDGQKQTLDDAEADLEALKAEYTEAEKVEDLLEALPANSNPDDGRNVESYEEAKTAYEDLGDDKEKVNPDAVKKLDNLKTALTAYRITKGSGSKWVKGSSEDLSFTANGYFGKFSGVKIDGKRIDSDKYAAKSGSTIVTLKASYLKTLKTGKHTISVLFGDGDFEGAASCEFQVVTSSGNPFTGDSSNILLWTGLAMTSLLCMAAMVFGKKKHA